MEGNLFATFLFQIIKELRRVGCWRCASSYIRRSIKFTNRILFSVQIHSFAAHERGLLGINRILTNRQLKSRTPLKSGRLESFLYQTVTYQLTKIKLNTPFDYYHPGVENATLCD
jgi:hypothetical protein